MPGIKSVCENSLGVPSAAKAALIVVRLWHG